MTKQELINEIKEKFNEDDFSSRALVLELIDQIDEPEQREPCEVCRSYGRIDESTTHYFNYLTVTGNLPQCVLGQYPSHANYCPSCGRKL